MENKDFKDLIEEPLRVNKQRMIHAESYREQEVYRSNNIVLGACISRTIRLCLQYPEQAKQYYDSLPKATMD